MVDVVILVVAVLQLLLGVTLGYWLRTFVAVRQAQRLTLFYEGLLRAELVEQHVYLDPPAIIYAATFERLAYVGQTTQMLEKRIYQHGRGTSGFDRVYMRKPEQWTWTVLEEVPTTYRFAAERAWIKRYSTTHVLLNGNDGTVDGQEWTLTNP